MKRTLLLVFCILAGSLAFASSDNHFPAVTEQGGVGYFPLSSAAIYTDSADYQVVSIAAGMLADDVERVTGSRPSVASASSLKQLSSAPVVVAGTIGHSRAIDELVKKGLVDVSGIAGKWESYIVATVARPRRGGQMLVVVGSDRRGTAFGLTSLSEAIGVSPWYWWADVTPQHKEALYVEPCSFVQHEPSVQYRGIFINDERFGGWARWAEQHFEAESGKVGPKTYQKVFELLLRLKANYLWPAMHPGTQAFNADPENARLADDYAIVMGTSHCEQMLRNNEGEWKAVNQQAIREGRPAPLGDFNYITNRKTMQDYWETRVKTNGRYENTYTLGLRGIHDYPMEGANTTAERVRLMQQAIDDQRDMLRRNIDKPIEEIPQVLCTYEEVLEAYHNGLQVPEDVTMLWSDDKHGYCRNLSNPEEMKRPGGAGIYYHLSYHGDPASWIWLSPLSPAFVSTELTKAYTFGARKIWVFNVGDIKPAEKEISFVMELAWDIEKWAPEVACGYIREWASKTFNNELADEIAAMQAEYYRLQAAGKDSHVWFVEYSAEQIATRVDAWRALAARARALAGRIPESLQNAYFELVSYPICGAAMINEYQLLARRSMVRADAGDSAGALADAQCVEQMFAELNAWTHHYNNEIVDGKWREFFSWQPYQWTRSEKIEQPYCTPSLLEQPKLGSRFVSVDEALSAEGAVIESESEGSIDIWMKALSPIRNFSKAPEDNVFCHICCGARAASGVSLSADVCSDSFDASATPINNVWHAPYVGPMWSRVGTLHLSKGANRLCVSELKSDARIDQIYLGIYPPFAPEPRLRIPAAAFSGMRGDICCIQGLGYSDGVMVREFDTPSYDSVEDAPYVEYEFEGAASGDASAGADSAACSVIEIRTLPTLHVYEGRDARYAVQVGDAEPVIFSIHAGDFSAEWRLNVLRGYASRTITLSSDPSCKSSCKDSSKGSSTKAGSGKQTVKIYFLDPGIVLQEILVR